MMARFALLLIPIMATGCDMSEEHLPIDSKDGSAEYRAHVWDAVRQRIGSDLTPLKEGATFDGTWDVEFDMFGTRRPMARYEFGTDGSVTIVTLMGADQTPQSETYEVRAEGRMMVSGETYYAATTESGELVLFNGDQSLVMVATNSRDGPLMNKAFHTEPRAARHVKPKSFAAAR